MRVEAALSLVDALIYMLLVQQSKVGSNVQLKFRYHGTIKGISAVESQHVAVLQGVNEMPSICDRVKLRNEFHGQFERCKRCSVCKR